MDRCRVRSKPRDNNTVASGARPTTSACQGGRCCGHAPGACGEVLAHMGDLGRGRDHAAHGRVRQHELQHQRRPVVAVEFCRPRRHRVALQHADQSPSLERPVGDDRHAAVLRSQKRRVASMWLAPALPELVHTFSAENSWLPRGSLAMPSPMTSCDAPYIGELSTRRPPPRGSSQGNHACQFG